MWGYKQNCKSRQIYGRSLLDHCVWSTSGQSSIGYSTWMSSVSSYNTAKPRIIKSCLRQMMLKKYSKMQHIFLIMDSTGRSAVCLTFEKAPVELILSPNWHVTPRFTIFEILIFVVKWQKLVSEMRKRLHRKPFFDPAFGSWVARWQ